MRALVLSEDPLRVRSAGGDLLLSLRHQFRSVREPEAPRREQWHVSTLRYYYRLTQAEDGAELVSWHWHPDVGVAYPHLHAPVSEQVGRRVHLPCGRVSIESILRLLLGELGAPALRHDWARVLDEAEERFIRYRRWSSSTQAPTAAPPA